MDENDIHTIMSGAVQAATEQTTQEIKTSFGNLF